MRIIIVIALLLTTVAHAQERAAASGAMGAQMNWSALSTKVDSANQRTDAVNNRVDQIVVCGRKGMTFAPGASGADAQGCMAPQNITKILGCGSQGAVYSPATDSCMQVNKPRWFATGQAPSTEAYGCQYNSGYAFNCKTRGINPPAGYPICGSTEGIPARLCNDAGNRCARLASASSTSYNPPSCTNIHFGDSQSCNSGGNVTSTSTWYDLYACE